MKILKEYLMRNYRKKALEASEKCLSFDTLYGYSKNALPSKERQAAELHLAGCYCCLDALLACSDSPKGMNRTKGVKLKREHLFLLLAVISFAASFMCSSYFLQFLAATMIFGIKWIVDSRSTRMLVMIHDAWKRGGEVEVGRVLKENADKKRVNF
ncbi:MAG: hypothetical protein ABH875_06170 [Candidatus Omnitrophota bacterium]